jgi:xylulokinase
MQDLILTIDVGTSRCKSTVFDAAGQDLERAVAEYQTYYPHPGWAEQAPEDWWQAVVATIRTLSNRVRGFSTKLRAISVTGQMHGLVCVDSNGRALRPCLTLHDRRSVAETQYLGETLGQEMIFRVTGERLDPTLPAPKLLWLRRHDPDVFQRMHYFLACKDYVRLRLTGNLATDPIDAAATSLMDLQQGRWSAALLEACQIPETSLPPIRPATAIDGLLTVAAAQELGLKAGVPIAVGAGDDVELIGAGLVKPGMALEHLGTTGSLLLCTDIKTMDWSSGLEVYPHPVPGLWILGGSTSSAGAALKWAADLFAMSGDLDFANFSEAGANTSVIFLPYLAGERSPLWNPKLRGAFFGLGLDHRKADLIKAIFEGVAFSLRHVLDALDGLGTRPRIVRVAGEFSTDRAWTRLRASIYRVPLAVLAQSDPTALGAMIIGAAAVGLYPDLLSAVAQVVSVQDTVLPDKKAVLHYNELYDLYRQMSDACSSISGAPVF